MAIKQLWTEQYRPADIEGYVFRDETQREQVKQWIKEGTIPHLLFSGSAGIGKTTLAKILITALNIDEYDILQINASRDNGVDFIRTRIEGFVSTMPFGKFKIVLLDECLDENTEVVIMRNGVEQLVKIKNVNDSSDLVKSFNTIENRIEWKPFLLFDKGNQEVLEINFENGETVICTPDHKWYVSDNGESKVVKASELANYMHILTA